MALTSDAARIGAASLIRAVFFVVLATMTGRHSSSLCSTRALYYLKTNFKGMLVRSPAASSL